jgi:uridylate kinase
MAKKIKITVVVSGGNVQDVYSSDPGVQVEVIDFDNIKNDGSLSLEDSNALVTDAEAWVKKISETAHHVW